MSSALTITEIATIAVAANSLSGGGITNALGFGGGGSGSVGGGSGAGVQQAADPFAPYRGSLATMYSGALMPGAETDPTKMPGYTQFKSGVLDPALEASKRSSAASGMLRSGNEQIALENTAQKGYYGFMTDYMNRLAQGSGATNNPATAVGMGVAQGNLNDAAVMQGFSGLATGASKLFSSNSGFSDNYGWSNGGNGTIDVNGYSGSVGNYFAPQASTVEYT